MTKKPNSFKFSHSDQQDKDFKNNFEKNSLTNQIPRLRVHFKLFASQKDNLPVYIYSLNNVEKKIIMALRV